MGCCSSKKKQDVNALPAVRTRSSTTNPLPIESSAPLIGALIAVQKPVAEGDKVTAWQKYCEGTGQFDPGTVVAVHGDGTYDVRFDKPAYQGKEWRDGQMVDNPLVPVLTVAESKILESRPQLVDYKPTHGGGAEGRRHLKAGVLYQGLLMLLEMIGFLYWDAESEGGKRAEKEWGKYSLVAAGYVVPSLTGWRYSKSFSRADFPAIQWADQAYGPVKPHEYKYRGETLGSFNWCGILGYDVEEWIRRWLRTNGNAEYKTFETLSLLEVALVDERFAAVRPFIGYADLFFSHAGDHTVQ